MLKIDIDNFSVSINGDEIVIRRMEGHTDDPGDTGVAIIIFGIGVLAHDFLNHPQLKQVHRWILQRFMILNFPIVIRPDIRGEWFENCETSHRCHFNKLQKRKKLKKLEKAWKAWKSLKRLEKAWKSWKGLKKLEKAWKAWKGLKSLKKLEKAERSY